MHCPFLVLRISPRFQTSKNSRSAQFFAPKSAESGFLIQRRPPLLVRYFSWGGAFEKTLGGMESLFIASARIGTKITSPPGNPTLPTVSTWNTNYNLRLITLFHDLSFTIRDVLLKNTALLLDFVKMRGGEGPAQILCRHIFKRCMFGQRRSVFLPKCQ